MLPVLLNHSPHVLAVGRLLGSSRGGYFSDGWRWRQAWLVVDIHPGLSTYFADADSCELIISCPILGGYLQRARRHRFLFPRTRDANAIPIFNGRAETVRCIPSL
jgi:hypothetical protein